MSGAGYLGLKAANPFEPMIAKYDTFFGNETAILHQKIEIMNQKKDLMLQMRKAIQGLEMERQVDEQFHVGQILIDQYRDYKKFQERAYEFIDEVIEAHSQQYGKDGEAEFPLSISSSN